MLVKYIRKNFSHVNLHLIFHKGKQHGITEDALKKILAIHKEIPIDLLMTPDSASGDFKEHLKLYEQDITTIVLDHHPVGKESQYAIVVNNQISPNYENKQLSGAGIVLKFLEAVDDAYGIEDSKNYWDLAAIGNIADSMNMTSPETRYIVYEGLKNIKNDFLKELFNNTIGDSGLIYPMQLSFNAIPKINGIIRVGKDEEKVDLFNAFSGVEEMFFNTRRKKNETLAEKVARLCGNAHSRQKKARTTQIELIKEQIQERSLNDNSFLLIELDEKFNRDLGGLIAGNLAGEYRKPVLMMIYNKKDKMYSGSLRGYDAYLKDTKQFLKNLNLFEFLEGHPNACGFGIKEQNYKGLNDAINEAAKDIESKSGVTEVDFEITEDQLSIDLVEKVFEYEYLWGKGVDKPLFALNTIIDTSTVKKSNSSNMIEWYKNNDWKDVKFVQFNGDSRIINMMSEGKKADVTLIGSLAVSNFAGRVNSQFLVEEVLLNKILDKEQDNKIIEEKSDLLDELFAW